MKLKLLSTMVSLSALLFNVHAEVKTVTVGVDDFDGLSTSVGSYSTKAGSEAAQAGFTLTGYGSQFNSTSTPAYTAFQICLANGQYIVLKENLYRHKITKVEVVYATDFYPTTWHKLKFANAANSAKTSIPLPDCSTADDTYFANNFDSSKDQVIEHTLTNLTFTSSDVEEYFFLIGDPTNNNVSPYLSVKISQIKITYEENESSEEVGYNKVKVTSTTLPASYEEIFSLEEATLTFNCDGENLWFYPTFQNAVNVIDKDNHVASTASVSFADNQMKLTFNQKVDAHGTYNLHLPKGCIGNAEDASAATEKNDEINLEFKISYDGNPIDDAEKCITVASSSLPSGTYSELPSEISIKFQSTHEGTTAFYFNAGATPPYVATPHGVKQFEIENVTNDPSDPATLVFHFPAPMSTLGFYRLIIPEKAVTNAQIALNADEVNDELFVAFGARDKIEITSEGLHLQGSSENGTIPTLGKNSLIAFKYTTTFTAKYNGITLYNGSNLAAATKIPVGNTTLRSEEPIGYVMVNNFNQHDDKTAGRIEYELTFVDPEENIAILNTPGHYTFTLPAGVLKSNYLNTVYESPEMEVEFEVAGGVLKAPLAETKINHVHNRGYVNGIHQMTTYDVYGDFVPASLSDDVVFEITPGFEPKWDNDVHGVDAASHEANHHYYWYGTPAATTSANHTGSLSFNANVAGKYTIKCSPRSSSNYTSSEPIEIPVEITPTFDKIYIEGIHLEEGDNTVGSLRYEPGHENLKNQRVFVYHSGSIYYKVTGGMSERQSNLPQMEPATLFRASAIAEEGDEIPEGYQLMTSSGIDLSDATKLDLMLKTNGATATHSISLQGVATEVSEVAAEDASAKVYYTLSGVKVSEPQSGEVYLEVENGRGRLVKF